MRDLWSSYDLGTRREDESMPLVPRPTPMREKNAEESSQADADEREERQGVFAGPLNCRREKNLKPVLVCRSEGGEERDIRG
uniref:Uncharacterized protein n=1 Tax=Cannabis sativa TaxID=3483 RepID=A0A803NUM8_CANSA